MKLINRVTKFALTATMAQLGFRVIYASHFDLPTKMTDGEAELQHWLKGVAGSLFSRLRDIERENPTHKIAAELRDEQYINGDWYIDYKRIRFMAIKECVKYLVI